MSGAAEAAAVASPTKSGGGGEDAELPKALLKRILKARLAEWDAQQNGGDGSRDFQINKDALLACSEAAKLFIHYLASTASDNCKDAKRQTISAAYRAENKEKAKKRADASKKRKAADKGGEGGEQQQEQGEQPAGGEAMEADAAGDDTS
ncbi:hypothetical protein COHA_000227 [Chlorella ohadii]|uniref:Transcription factor CBF/NF-Y/archaeal histone domain-containing protein n=1 Tax=Chlorella ohadii TaxID=2649997 RepID=A0AAD5HA38_9CHLO|nr:hypothetical protein COHA_000227 [Chlorella ohadii]